MKYINGILLHDTPTRKFVAVCNHKHLKLSRAYRCLGMLSSESGNDWDTLGRIYRFDNSELLPKEKIELIELEVKLEKKI